MDAVITVNIRSLYGTFGEALRHAAFQVGSIITTMLSRAVYCLRSQAFPRKLLVRHCVWQATSCPARPSSLPVRRMAVKHDEGI